MIYFVCSFLVGVLATLFIVRSTMRHGRLSVDHDLSGPQKFHGRPVPRIGGAAVMLSIIAGTVVAQINKLPAAPSLWLLVAAALPAFAAGMVEDLTKRVMPRWRLLATVASGATGIYLLDAVIQRTDIPGVDLLVPWVPFAVALTLLTIAGVSNSINIIDGFNGLASMCAFLMMLAMAYVAFQVGDSFVFTATL